MAPQAVWTCVERLTAATNSGRTFDFSLRSRLLGADQNDSGLWKPYCYRHILDPRPSLSGKPKFWPCWPHSAYFVQNKISAAVSIIKSFWDYNVLLYPAQMCFPIGGGYVTSRWSKLTNFLAACSRLLVAWRWAREANSLGKQQLELWTPTWSDLAPKNCGETAAKRRQANDFFAAFFFFFSNFELRGITKQFITGPAENCEYVSPRLNFPLGFASGNIEGLVACVAGGISCANVSH